MSDVRKPFTLEELRTLEEEHGCKVVYDRPNYLLLDLDTEEAHNQLVDRINELEQRMDVDVVALRCTPSQSGLPHRHCELMLAEEAPLDIRIFMQLFLGSDHKREAHNMTRALNHVPATNIFIEGPWKEAGLR